MAIISTILEIILISITVALVVLLPLAIIFNVKAGRKYRQQLAENIHHLRLNRMLTALGIDTAEYLHRERAVDIHEQMTRCGECQNIETCDDTLADVVDVDNIGFCNNEASLREMVKKKHATEQ
ncbi:MAG: DUF6455 family protein [Proteobacteria bacterium]|nr:DUF6455 family protein [Pseudomonadota bacterium]